MVKVTKIQTREVQGSLAVEVDRVTTRRNDPVLMVRRHVRGFSVCPARGKTCSICNRRNHFAAVCRAKKEKCTEAVAYEVAEARENINDYYCDGVESQVNSVIRWYQELVLENRLK
ncbi:hypothetical protein PR048_024263 [Dryococelus australis]|uniref:Uncharacterized protein n=1 Tax=Dryococelus australis TaxID=614101 RepID=A0ABQ9GN37_9NEOP|nr:hypothetical protein PR048_024263 [Dryococelus australis]